MGYLAKSVASVNVYVPFLLVRKNLAVIIRMLIEYSGLTIKMSTTTTGATRDPCEVNDCRCAIEYVPRH